MTRQMEALHALSYIGTATLHHSQPEHLGLVACLDVVALALTCVAGNDTEVFASNRHDGPAVVRVGTERVLLDAVLRRLGHHAGHGPVLRQ